MAEARWGCVAAGSDWGFCCLSLLPVRKEIIEEVLRLDLIEPESLSLLVSLSFWAYVDLRLSRERWMRTLMLLTRPVMDISRD